MISIKNVVGVFLKSNLFCSRCGNEWYSLEFMESGIIPIKCPFCFQRSIHPIPHEYFGLRQVFLKIIVFFHKLKSYYRDNHECFLDLYDYFKSFVKIFIFLMILAILFYLMLTNIKIY